MRAADDAGTVGVLDRMTSILEAFDDDDGGLGITDLALRTNMPKSTVSRLVASLVRQRYLERDGKRIHLGLRLFELGQLADEPRELRAAALPVMAELRNKTGQNVHVAMRDGREMVCLAVMRGKSAPPPAARTGGRVPLHATALGKAVLAHASDFDEIVASGLDAWTRWTITDPERLRLQLAGIRRGEPALERQEFAAGVSCMASPVFADSRRFVVAISVSGCATDFDADRLASPLREAALALARRVGGCAPSSA